MHDVITFGSATLDVFLKCNNLETFDHQGEEKIAFPYGSKIEVDNALFETGGGGTNSATTFSRQGLNVAIVAKIGKDFPASQVVSKLTQEKINTQRLVQDENDATDFATIIWAPMKGSVILINRGKGKLEVSDIDWDSLNTKWFFISSVEGNLDILRKISSYCDPMNESKIKIAWNPGKREIEHKDIIMELLPHIELLIVNRSEAMFLIETNSHHPELISGSDGTISEVLDNFQRFPCKKVLITDGHNGSYYWNGDQWIHAGVFKIERQEATGAGDAFGSAFVAGLIKGMSEEDSLKLAAANAASVVTSPSAKKGILTEEQSKEWMGKELEIKTI